MDKNDRKILIGYLLHGLAGPIIIGLYIIIKELTS
jgi:hypothetical protein